MSLVSIKDLPLLCNTMFWYLSSLDLDYCEGGEEDDVNASMPPYQRKRAVDDEGGKEEEEEHEIGSNSSGVDNDT